MMSGVEIESPANPRIRAAIALRERRERDATGLTLVDGARESLRAIQAGTEVETAFVCRGLLGKGDGEEALEALGRGRGRREIVDVSARAFERLAFGDRVEGIVLVIRQPPTDLERLRLPRDPLVVVTEDVEKPGNLGAILRSADGAGVHAVIAAGGTDLYNPNVVRASVGTVFGMQVAAAPAARVHEWLLGQRLRILATRVDAERLHVDADLRGGLGLVLGSEASGLSETWRGDDVEAIRLPMMGVADSLNVSAASAILVYEAWRQRRADSSRDEPPQSP